MYRVSCSFLYMSKTKSAPLYGYYSHNHASIPGCEISIYRNPQGREVLVTGFGSTENPKDSGYHYPQTLEVGKITAKWQLLHLHRVKGVLDPQYLLDPEEI